MVGPPAWRLTIAAVQATWIRPTARVAMATPWMAAFTLLVLAQTAHLLEHVAQMIQLHALGLSSADARGIVGQLDIEWVHFVWNVVVVGVLGVLLLHAPSNRWLVAACLVAAWHLIEHDVIMMSFLATGIPGSPGLLASGGPIGGGLPLSRPDLHFLYNVVELAAIGLAYRWQLRAGSARRAIDR